MNPRMSIPAIAVAAAFILSAPSARAQVCDISQTKCALNGGKCNIKFKNRTGDSGGSEGSSNINQRSNAMTIVIKARKGNGDKAGNKLQIPAGTSKTMNMDKKANKDFYDVRAISQDFSNPVQAVAIPCEDIQTILNGTGTCKIFHGIKAKKTGQKLRYLGYQCDGGNVGGPNNATARD